MPNCLAEHKSKNNAEPKNELGPASRWRRCGDLNPSAGRTDLPDFESGPFNHLGTSPYMLTRIREVNALFNFIRILIRTQRVLKLLVCGKPAWLKALLSFDFSKQRNISSQARYDHFDTAPYMLNRCFSSLFFGEKGLWKELTERTANLFNFRTG